MTPRKLNLSHLPDRIELSAIVELADDQDGNADRRFTARLLTYGETTGDWRNLSFAEGSINPDGPVPLAYAHLTGGGFFGGEPVIVGKSIEFWDEDGAAFGEFEVSTTEKADEIWTLITDGSLTAVSVGVQLIEYTLNEEAESVTVLDAELLEVSVVPIPAMRSARIVKNQDRELVTLAADPGEKAMEEGTPTDPTIEERLATIEDVVRAQATTEPEGGLPTTGKARGGQFRNLGELFTTVATLDKGGRGSQLGDPVVARDKLGKLLEDGHVYFTPNGMRMIDVFAFEDGTIADAATDPDAKDGLLKLLRNGRVTSNFFAKGDLDTVPGASVPSRDQSEQALVDYQSENGAVASNKVEVTANSFPKATLAGGQGMSLQARDWSQPSFMDEVLEDLVEAYGEKVNEEVVNGAGTAGPPQKVEGITVAQAARINAGGADTAARAIAFVASVAEAKGDVYGGSKRWPSVAFANGDTLALIEGWTDSDGRPLLATDGASNAIGTTDGPSPAGRIRGLTVYADDAVGANLMIVSSFRDAKLWESQSSPIQIGLTYPDVLTVDVAVYGYLAVAIRRPDAFAVIERIGIAAS